jgi:hypothetical protein
MSKLIDANKLPYEDLECTDGRTYMVINACDIENAPTVKAIPIDRIKQARKDIEKIQLQGVNTGVIMQKDVLTILDELIAEEE